MERARTGQLSQLQLEPQLQVPEEAQPQLPIVNRMYESGSWKDERVSEDS